MKRLICNGVLALTMMATLSVHVLATNENIPVNLYVIEQAHIDGIVIWQSETGEVFQSMPNAPVMKIADSLLEYCGI